MTDESIDLGIPGTAELVRIGSGGNAVVYRARQPDLDRHVVVKVLMSVDIEATRRRFDRERRAMGRLSEAPGVAPVYGSGFTSAGQPYLIMPFYERGSLQTQLEADGPFEPALVRRLGEKICSAVHVAHLSGVVHRDLKPANILLRRNGEPDVADFGIAQLLDETGGASMSLTMTPLYTAPEVFDGKDSGALSDVYSIGALMFALLAGSPAFSDPSGTASVLSLMRRVAEDPLPPLPASTPVALAHVVQRAMSKDPLDRWPTAQAMAQALSLAAQSTQAPAPAGVVGVPTMPVPLVSSGAPSSAGAVGRPANRSVDPVRVANDKLVANGAPSERGISGRYVGAVAALLGVAVVSLLLWAPWSGSEAPSDTDLSASISSTPMPTGVVEAPGLTPGEFNLETIVDIVRPSLVAVESFGCGGYRSEPGVLLPDGLVLTGASAVDGAWTAMVVAGSSTFESQPLSADRSSGLAMMRVSTTAAGGAATAEASSGDEVAVIGVDGRSAQGVVNVGAGGTAVVGISGDPVEIGDVVALANGALIGRVAAVTATQAAIAPIAGLADRWSGDAPNRACTSAVFGSISVDPAGPRSVEIRQLVGLQALNDAYANEEWDRVRSIEAGRQDVSDQAFVDGWGPLDRGFVYPLGRVGSDTGTTSWRMALIGHETWNDREITTMFCVTWAIDANQIGQTNIDTVRVYGSQAGESQLEGHVEPSTLLDTAASSCA